jgi:uncharacterized protein YjiS (DUF1127 family)
MSVYIENNHHNNISQYLPTCEAPSGSSVKHIIAKAIFWKNRARQRKQLACLDTRMLADIGVTLEQAKLEAAKPFWQ